MSKFDPYDSATSEDDSSLADEVAQSSKKERTPEQEAAVQRHLRRQNNQRSGDEQTDGGAQPSIANSGPGIAFRIGLKVMRSGGKLFLGGGGRADVYWGYPIGAVIVLVGAVISCLGLAIWAVLAMGQAIYRAISK